MVESICFISFSFHYDPLALLQEGQVVRETIGIKNSYGLKRKINWITREVFYGYGEGRDAFFDFVGSGVV